MLNSKELSKTRQNGGTYYKYSAVKQTLSNEELEVYDTYGIQLEGAGIIVDDVACDREEALRIADLINEHQADPINVQDIIVDLLA